MPRRGRGYLMPPKWRERGLRFGVEELTKAVGRAARHVRTQDRRATLGVADLSPLRGGKSVWHRSHQSGRDVDLIFYSTDEKGKPLEPPDRDMIRYDKSGEPYVHEKNEDGYVEEDWERRRFDVRRNWLLVEALLSDPTIRVQWIFVSNALKAKMLGWARRKRRPTWLVEYARVVMRQPGDSALHDDHFHVRIYCPRADSFRGCEDTGPVWQHEKKTFKYGGPERYDPVLWRMASLTHVRFVP
jgi:penicillin-insensitive murein endopeptidase